MITELSQEDVEMRNDMFDGDISEPDSDSSLQAPPTVVSHKSSGRTPRKKKVDEATKRPQRSKNTKNYAESDTEEDNTPRPSARLTVASGKRRRESVTESPSKRAKIIPGKPSRKRAFSVDQQPQNGRNLHTSTDPISRSQPTPSKNPKSGLVALRSKIQVFIKLDTAGLPTTSPDNYYWWPAKVVRPIGAEGAILKLYGDDAHGQSREVTIQASSLENIQSLYSDGVDPRYWIDSFQSDTLVDPSRLKSAFDEIGDDENIDEDWETAFHYEDARDESIPPSEHSHKPNSRDAKEEFRPPSPSLFTEFVGARVLCKGNAHSSSGAYWPARVVEYIPPTKATEKPRFKINFFDWKSAKLPRDCFFTQYDEDEVKFADCELDRKKLQDWIQKNSILPSDEDPFEFDITAFQVPSGKIPKPRVFIDALEIDKQFAYVIPFMEKILKEEYPPSQPRIDHWMQGSSYARSVMTRDQQYGNLADVESVNFRKLVVAWAFPDESPSTMGEEASITNTVPVRPRGSERYEALDSGHKRSFVMDVVTGEAIIQLLLLRDGKRETLDILGDQEESDLYAIGRELAGEESTSILVENVLDARREARKRLGMKPELPFDGSGETGATQETGGRGRRAQLRNGK